jgi:hypothetical protein
MSDMVTIGGVRYRREDAIAKGLLAGERPKPERLRHVAEPAPENKARSVGTLNTGRGQRDRKVETKAAKEAEAKAKAEEEQEPQEPDTPPAEEPPADGENEE